MARHDVDVTGLGVSARKDARAVHPLALHEHLDEVLAGVDHEGERLQPSVATDVAQVHLAQLQLLDGSDEIAAGELFRRLLEQANKRVGFEDVVGHDPGVPVDGAARRRTIDPR
jgi:hypothetical protein